MFKRLFKKKTDETVTQDSSPSVPKEHPLGEKKEGEFIFPTFKQPEQAPKVTSDNGFIGNVKPVKSNSYGINWSQIEFFAPCSQFIGYQTCAMIATNWLIDKACNMPARDAIRNGYLLTCGSDEISQKLRDCDDGYRVIKNLKEIINFGRVYGGRIILFKVKSANPKEYYKNPFNLDGVKAGQYEGMSQIDPNWIEPVLTDENISDPANIEYYEPTYWRIKDIVYHKSHLQIFIPYPVPDFLKPTYKYLGLSVPQRILERVYAAERSANEAPQLLMTKRLTTLKVSDTALSSTSKMNEALLDWMTYRDNYGVKVMAGDEQISQFDTALSDVDVVIMTSYQLVAAASGVPATKLLGTQPKGFNATGEYEESIYREELESIQTNDLSPILKRHYQILAKSEGIPTEAISIQWNPLDSPTAKEWAEIDNLKAQRDKALFDTGAIDAVDIRDRVRQDKESDYHNISEGELNGEEAINQQAVELGNTKEQSTI